MYSHFAKTENKHKLGTGPATARGGTRDNKIGLAPNLTET